MTKEEHKIKMINRRIEQDSRTPSKVSPILANIGRNHRDFGTSPKEHANLKAERSKNDVR